MNYRKPDVKDSCLFTFITWSRRDLNPRRILSTQYKPVREFVWPARDQLVALAKESILIRESDRTEVVQRQELLLEDLTDREAVAQWVRRAGRAFCAQRPYENRCRMP